MRILRKLQLVLEPKTPSSDVGKELKEIGSCLSLLPNREEILKAVAQDLSRGKTSPQSEKGMTAEQALIVGVLRNRFDWSYRQLEHQTKDSLSIRSLLGLKMEEFFSKSTLQDNVKAIRAETWDLINESIKQFALAEGIEDGTLLRGDTTAVETNIHYPTDASLVNDVVRVMTRTLKRLSEYGVSVECSDHTRRAKSRLFDIHNTKSERKAYEPYCDLINVGEMTLAYGEKSLESIEKLGFPEIAHKEVERLKRLVPQAKRVISQARRRIIEGENVPAEEKILSIFEDHTDIIVKGQREATFGHKISLGIGAVLILSVEVLTGNPQDKTTLPNVIDRHVGSYGTAPHGAAFDGAYASDANFEYAKKRGVKELTFSKNGTLAVKNLVSAKAVDSMLVRFRAGAEGVISFLKRCFGCRRVMDRGIESFKAKLSSAVVSFNLLALGRARIRTS
jgi:IS5 family transposase